MNPTDKTAAQEAGTPLDEDLPLRELPDGSVQVGAEAPAGDAHDDDDDDRPVEGGAGTASEQHELETAKTEEEREAIRERRRQERKHKRQRAQDREEQLRSQLNRTMQENQALNERLGLIERKTSGSELAQLDNAISQTANIYEQSKAAVSESIARNDGQAAVEATERMVVARERHRELAHIRQQYTAAPQRATPPPLDPELVRHARSWAERNPWYSQDGKDVDSRLALTLDKSVVDDGYAPNTAEYWAELDRRVAKYLPHRVARRDVPGGQDRDILGAADPARSKPSKSVVTGSGRESAPNGGGSYALSAERVQAMKDAGMWNDVNKRNQMIREYRDYDRTHGSGSAG